MLEPPTFGCGQASGAAQTAPAPLETTSLAKASRAQAGGVHKARTPPARIAGSAICAASELAGLIPLEFNSSHAHGASTASVGSRPDLRLVGNADAHGPRLFLPPGTPGTLRESRRAIGTDPYADITLADIVETFATAATACRAMEYQGRERAKKLENPPPRQG